MEDEVEVLRTWIRKRQAPPLPYFEGMLAEAAMAGNDTARAVRRLAWTAYSKGTAILFQEKLSPGTYRYWIAKRKG